MSPQKYASKLTHYSRINAQLSVDVLRLQKERDQLRARVAELEQQLAGESKDVRNCDGIIDGLHSKIAVLQHQLAEEIRGVGQYRRATSRMEGTS